MAVLHLYLRHFSLSRFWFSLISLVIRKPQIITISKEYFEFMVFLIFLSAFLCLHLFILPSCMDHKVMALQSPLLPPMGTLQDILPDCCLLNKFVANITLCQCITYQGTLSWLKILRKNFVAGDTNLYQEM